LTAHHGNKKALGVFLMEIAPSATCMAPGIIGVTSGRPRVQGNMVHVSCLVEKSQVVPKVVVGKKSQIISIPFQVPTFTSSPSNLSRTLDSKYSKPLASMRKEQKKTVPLVAIAYARSGDKGDSVNIGVISRKPEYYPWLREVLTEKVVHQYMRHHLEDKGEVKRFDLPGTFSLNFILTRALGGGGLSSLKVDRQGKSYAQMLLSMEIPVPSSWKLDRAKL
jgi:hypothetical protein